MLMMLMTVFKLLQRIYCERYQLSQPRRFLLSVIHVSIDFHLFENISLFLCDVVNKCILNYDF